VTLLSHASHGVSIVTTIALTPYVYRKLGADGYGLWLVLLSQISLLGLLDLDLHDSVVRNVTVLGAKGDVQRMRAIIANALLLALLVSAIGALLVGTLSGFLLREVIVPDDLQATIPALIGAAAVLFCCEQLSSVAEGVLLGAKQYLAGEVIGIVSTVADAAVVVTVLWRGGGLQELALATAATTVVWTVVTFLIAHRRVPLMPVSLRCVSRDMTTWRPLFTFFAWSALISIAITVIHDTDTVLLGAVASVSAVAAYELALKVPLALWSVTETTFWGVFPFAADLHGRAKLEQLARTLIVGTKLAVALSAWFLLAGWVLGPVALELWVGQVADGAALLRLGLAVNMVWAGFLVAESLLYGCAQLRPLAAMYGLSVLVGVPAMVAFIVRWGAIGAVAGTALVGLILLVLIGAKAARFVGHAPLNVCREAIVTPLLPVAPLLLLLIAFERATTWDAPVRLAASVLVVACYPFVTAWTAFAPGERAVVTEQALGWWGAAGALLNKQLRRVTR
jgi:O-antigen/teichoic acid export membrane protein